ncbi:hypothetical protein BWR59_16890 [Pseudomonas sp. Bc-h]|uniref:hypothetical protein n=1 Tax=Pseudomonas sp. Bc-h TaxID=1943632 RepID=UPI0009D9186F|nr:hypothetical protein [Pseudomonas sp. Bc-h]OQR30237.1 hypothetical protein BWR59_16890 [Pseudomonas sp. Bc-h]
MSAEIYFKDSFHDLKTKFQGLTNEIHLVSKATMAGETCLLTACNIRHDEKLFFKDPELGTIDPLDYGTRNAAGVMIGFTREGIRQSAVFINDQLLEEKHDGLEWMWRYNSLHHELMHALDLSKQKNFNVTTMTIDLVAAEAFADTKTIKHLHSSKNAYHNFALWQYAKNVVSVRNHGPIRSKIFDNITKTVGAKNLEYWASDKYYEDVLKRLD